MDTATDSSKGGGSCSANWDVLLIKTLWIGNLVYFNAQSIGVSGEGNFFYAIFDIAMAFPSSLALLPLAGVFEKTISQGGHVGGGSGNEVVATAVSFTSVLVVGYLQWFIIVPMLARAGWRFVDMVADKSHQIGRLLEKAVGVVRVVLRWGGGLCILVAALNYIEAIPLAVLFLSGAVAVFLAFRPRPRFKG